MLLSDGNNCKKTTCKCFSERMVVNESDVNQTKFLSTAIIHQDKVNFHDNNPFPYVIISETKDISKTTWYKCMTMILPKNKNSIILYNYLFIMLYALYK